MANRSRSIPSSLPDAPFVVPAVPLALDPRHTYEHVAISLSKLQGAAAGVFDRIAVQVDQECSRMQSLHDRLHSLSARLDSLTQHSSPSQEDPGVGSSPSLRFQPCLLSPPHSASHQYPLLFPRPAITLDTCGTPLSHPDPPSPSKGSEGPAEVGHAREGEELSELVDTGRGREPSGVCAREAMEFAEESEERERVDEACRGVDDLPQLLRFFSEAGFGRDAPILSQGGGRGEEQGCKVPSEGLMQQEHLLEGYQALIGCHMEKSLRSYLLKHPQEDSEAEAARGRGMPAPESLTKSLELRGAPNLDDLLNEPSKFRYVPTLPPLKPSSV